MMLLLLLSGATATSTHGTGKNLGSVSTAVVGVRLVSANGTVVDASSSSLSWGSGGGDDPASLLSLARVGLGALGVATEVS
jgi:hypothetical protein